MNAQRTRLALALGLVLAVPGCATRVGIIRLANQGDSCLVEKTEKIVVEVKKPVEQYSGMAWVIDNRCGVDRRVKVKDFKQGGKDTDPPVNCSSNYYVDVPKGQIRVIACVVKPDEKIRGKYSYAVVVGDQTLDPDIIIKRK